MRSQPTSRHGGRAVVTRRAPDLRTRRLETYRHDGLTFDVVDRGSLTGPVVVLLHGFPQRATSWARVADILAERGFRTWAPDQRGYSRGARPTRRSAYRLPCLVGDTVALLRRAATPVHLVGHDWGAAVAWATAATHPDLVRTLTTASVPHPAAFAQSLFCSAQAARSWYVLAFQPPGAVETVARHAPGLITAMLRRAGMTTSELARFREEIVDDGALPGALGWYRALPSSTATATRARVRVPTTHVWSGQDPTLSRRGAELTGRYVDADYELRILDDVTHWIPTQAPERLAAAILDRVGA